jgi:hypothetical protein
MLSTDELEEALLDAWHSAHEAELASDQLDVKREWETALDLLGVYADMRQQQGDPRGELITLDLIEGNPELQRRRSELIADWLGADLAGHPGLRIRYGLISLVSSEPDSGLLSEVLSSPGGRFVENVALLGSAAELASDVSSGG